MKRVELTIRGIVQGVGFRPFVYRTAHKYAIAGFVKNTMDGVVIEAQGRDADIEKFVSEIRHRPPSGARIKDLIVKPISLKKDGRFTIHKSNGQQSQNSEITPDIAVCQNCLKEIVDKKNRRYFYPFTNCVDCGPRFTIIERLPYDRDNTSMNEFKMCLLCEKEYTSPEDRRFHAQTNCCEKCGPEVFLKDSQGRNISRGIDAIKKTAGLLAGENIIAIKGIGGFHLACNAFSVRAVRTLRQRKNREEKPFALMAKNLEVVEKYCLVSDIEKKFLISPSAPIVLLKKKKHSVAFKEIAPKNKFLGIMLPYSGLHNLIFEAEQELELIVMTSGNYSEQPICTDNQQALNMLSSIADYFLFHDRKIITGCDDSVMRVLPDGQPLMIRRSRGFAPETMSLPFVLKRNILGCGANIKNTFSIASGSSLYISHHTGDLDSPMAFETYITAMRRFMNILKIEPSVIAYDAHPYYIPTILAMSQDFFGNAAKVPVYHHHAHICACMIDNELKNTTVIGIAFDGTGYGKDGTLWGSEFLLCDYASFERKAHLRPIKLPGGEQAIKQVWRIALAYLIDAFGKNFDDSIFKFLEGISSKEINIVGNMIENSINCPFSSGMGRLFDAVSCICGLRTRISYEGQAAAELESILDENVSDTPYNFDIIREDGKFILDHRITIREITQDILEKVPVSRISHRFHQTIVQMVREICELIKKDTGIREVALSGGSFQNVFLSVRIKEALEKDGFRVYTHRQIPPNDACISSGQCAVAGFS
ncbi:MAG: carbamoyltransferase HypF, partial [Candidatus Omnitrophica bacterium]|nr:carbamoyltransferase HypF [Candidatus Omnitrophota bacterium]